jgi:V8-like Glu-specific endopeptidase
MRQHTLALLASSILSAMVFASPSLAADVSAGNAGSGEISRAVGSVTELKAKAKAVPGITVDRSASRAVELDKTAATKAFTIIGRTSDGKEIKIEPGQQILDAIEVGKKGEKRSSIEGGGGDPAAAEDGGTRDVIGQDNRVQVTNTTKYPYTAIGYLQMENKKGEVWSCTAALIGPKVALTAAHCLYNHAEQGGWRDKFVFWPAVNGENNVPYGGFDYDTAYVFQAFVTDYDGTYDEVWQYDVGLITFKEPIGDALGWLGYTTGENTGDFQGNLVGYHDDKPAFTMWRSTCNVVAENASAADFVHDCDFMSGANGGPIYYYDQQTKDRIVIGVNMGPAGNNANWALKLYGPIYRWINTINK